MGRHGDPATELVRVTVASICEVIIVTFIGYLLARRGILDKPTTTKLNKINVSVFTPALLFSKVAFSLNAHRLVELAVVPIGFVLVEVVSMVAALALSKLGHLSSAHTRYAIAVAITPNSNSLPVALMQSLVVTVPLLRWDEPGEPEDDSNSMLGRALTYLVLFSTLGMFVRWSIGAHLLSSAGTSLAQGSSPSLSPARVESQHPPRAHHHAHPPRWAVSFPNSPVDSTASSDSDQNQDASAPASAPNGAPTSNAPHTPPQHRSKWHRYVVHPLHSVNNFMTAPLWAAIMSLVVALLPPLQASLSAMGPLRGALNSCGACSIPLTLVALGAYFVDAKTPAPTPPTTTTTTTTATEPVIQPDSNRPSAQPDHPAGGATSENGTAQLAPHGDTRLAVPTVTPSRPESVASTSYPDSESSGTHLKRLNWLPWRRTGQIRLEDNDAPRGPEEAKRWGMSEFTRTIAAAIGARMIVCPLILIPIMAYIAIKTRNNVMDDPVFLASACLIVGSPPALTLAQITTQTAQKAGRAAGDTGTVEKLISRTIFVAYTILATPTTIVLVLVALLIAEND